MSIEYLDLGSQPTIITTLGDITEFVGARESQARLASIVQNSDDAIFGKTLAGEITSWNAGAERLYGYAAAEAIGQKVDLIVPDDRRSEFERVMSRLRNGARIEPFETLRVPQADHRIVVAVSVSPLRDGAGPLIGRSTARRDNTARQRAEHL